MLTGSETSGRNWSSEKTSLRNFEVREGVILTKHLDSFRFRLDRTAADAVDVAAAAVVDEHPFCLETEQMKKISNLKCMWFT